MKQHGMQSFHTSRLVLLESRFCRFSYNEPWKMLHVRPTEFKTAALNRSATLELLFSARPAGHLPPLCYPLTFLCRGSVVGTSPFHTYGSTPRRDLV